MPSKLPKALNRLGAFRIVIRALNEKLARTKHKPTRAKLLDAKAFIANDPAFTWDAERLSLNPTADLYPDYRKTRGGA